MTAIMLGVIASARVFASALIGLLLHRRLPEPHLTKETQDVVKLGTGMVSVLSSLVLALLIATAKTSHDTTDHRIRSYAADLILLNETLRDYGADAAIPRDLLRRYTKLALESTWPTNNGTLLRVEDQQAGLLLENVREAIRALKPGDAGQQWLLSQALQISSSLLQQRWFLIEQQGATVQPIILVILISWISFIFASFGLHAPRNATVIVTFFICSLAIGGSVFMILEMDSPFTGVLRISRWPMENALAHMNP